MKEECSIPVANEEEGIEYLDSMSFGEQGYKQVWEDSI